MVNNKQSLFFGPNVLGLRGKSTTILEAIMLDAWNFLTLCTNGWSVFCLKIGKMEQFCEDSWKSSGKIPKLETVPKIPNIGLFQVSALSNGQTMHVAVTFLETFFHRFTPQVAPNMMVWKWQKNDKNSILKKFPKNEECLWANLDYVIEQSVFLASQPRQIKLPLEI